MLYCMKKRGKDEWLFKKPRKRIFDDSILGGFRSLAFGFLFFIPAGERGGKKKVCRRVFSEDLFLFYGVLKPRRSESVVGGEGIAPQIALVLYIDFGIRIVCEGVAYGFVQVFRGPLDIISVAPVEGADMLESKVNGPVLIGLDGSAEVHQVTVVVKIGRASCRERV